MKVTEKITITNEDNMLLMARYPDNYFDLAIVDPPYGIGMDGGSIGKGKKLTKKNWDNQTPNKEYFYELFRVSKNQIIWGGNYFILPLTKSWVYWDKMQDGYAETFSSGELAWSSFNLPMKQIRYKYQGNYEGYENSITTKSSKPHLLKIHPTQKPVALYKWILDKYAKENDKILDTHLGSGSIAIACHDYGFELTACELDKEYFDQAMKRINNHMAQTQLFR
jgi:site-specific DNA-methyltransferase (adenine-specific)